jgi:RNA-directed DNA polymerase
MKRVGNLYEQIVSFDNLRQAADAALKRGKRRKMPGARFFLNLEHELAELHCELNTGAYRHGGYTYFNIHEPKERQVAAAAFRDRVVHHAIVRVLEPVFETRFIFDSYACRKNKGTHAGMRRASEFAQKYKYALKCDVRRYFPSIDHGVLMKLIGRVIKDARTKDLIRNVLRSHADGVETEWVGEGLFDVQRRSRGLPIGNLTSQFLANVYLNALDQFVKHELRCVGYVRYVDDFLLFADSREQLRQWGARVREKLTELGLTIHPDKYRLGPTDRGVDFCGFVVFASGRIRVRKDSVRRFTRKYRNNLWRLARRQIPVSRVSQSVAAWVGHVCHAQSYKLRAAVLCRGLRKGRWATTGSSRGLRGGSWNNNSDNLRSDNRNDNDPANENNNIGFRLASP